LRRRTGLVSLLASTLAACNSALVHGLATLCEPMDEGVRVAYVPESAVDELLARFAPVFEVEAGDAPSNRIGTPTLSRRAGSEQARVDVDQPAVYAESHAEEIGGRTFQELVYRVHFDQFSWTIRALTSVHRNAGLLVLVLVGDGQPLTVTTVHTCGCWLAIQPTEALARPALPADWPEGELLVGGESLPAQLPVPSANERFVVRLRAGSHRVADVRVADPGALTGFAALRPLPLRALSELRDLPIAGTAGERGSFFYEAGYLRGYVKGAWAPLEGLTLGLLTLDPRLGMDRDFGDPAVTGARFFTALAPWKRERSRLDRFGAALAELGFRTAAFGPRGSE
jgi:hypothetical protein